MSSAPTRPVLRYFGGKWRLAPWIAQHFGPHRVYTEAYGGAASVLLQKPRSSAEVYNDLDAEVVNLFRVLQDPGAAAALKHILFLTPYARDEFELAYQPADDPVERARRTVIKAFMGFGSNAIHIGTPTGRGFRTRISTTRPPTSFRARVTTRPQTGFRTVAFRSGTTPAADWRSYVDALPSIVDRLRGVVIENRPAIEVLRRFDRSDALHYVDPPYPHSTRQRAGRDGYRFEMSDDDHRALAAVLRELEGMVVVSGYPCDLYDRDLFPDWQRRSRPARVVRARRATEVLWLNPRAAAGVQTTLFDDRR